MPVLEGMRVNAIKHGDFEINSKEFYSIISNESRLEKIATDFQYIEGPVWNAREDFLLFSDIPRNRIFKWSQKEGITIFCKPSGNSNGLTYDKEGHLIICEHGNRRLSKYREEVFQNRYGFSSFVSSTYAILADSFFGKRLNSPNDVVTKSDGMIYFTDPPYGIEPEQQELPFQGVFRVDPNNKELTLLVKDFDRPNGLAFSPDENIIYIADSSERSHIRAFDVNPDGTLSNSRIFSEIRSEKRGGPDGMKVDVEGNLYTTAPGGIWVFSPEGKKLGVIKTPIGPSNCAWGGADWRSLFITAKSLFRIQLAIPGVKVPP